MKKYFITFFLACILSGSLHADTQICDMPDTVSEIKCASGKLEASSKDLDSAYSVAISNIHDDNEFDARKSKSQLVKAQNSWLTYMHENCDFIGGLQGGSNGWVTYQSIQCQIDETKKRIYFLQHLPHGG